MAMSSDYTKFDDFYYSNYPDNNHLHNKINNLHKEKEKLLNDNIHLKKR